MPGMIETPDPGRLTTLGVIERFNETGRDAANQPVGNWVPAGNVWCEIIDLAGSTLETARQQWARTTHQVVLWSVPWVDVGMRLRVSTVPPQLYHLGYIPPNQAKVAGQVMRAFVASEV